jgi:hypothetical protein
VEHEQAQIKIVEMEECRDSLHLGYEKLENECHNLRDVTASMKQEKAEAKKTCEAEVAMIHIRFQGYRMHHRKKLHELCFNLENEMNEFGAQCLPYLRKGITFGNIVRWYIDEIKVMPATFAKANRKNSCYAIVGVLRMLQGYACEHLSELQSFASSCDASLLDDLLPELTNLSGRLVQKW